MNYTYTYTYTPLFTMILPILALLLILAGGIALYTLFVRKPNHYHGAAAKLHDFLNFRHAYTEGLLKILYCMTVAALAVYSVILLFFHFFWAILLFIVGNIAARLGYEFIMMLFSMHRTLRSIDRKMPAAVRAADSRTAARAAEYTGKSAPARSAVTQTAVST